MIDKLNKGKPPNKRQKDFIKQLIGKKKITRPSKKFRGRDRKTHQDP